MDKLDRCRVQTRAAAYKESTAGRSKTMAPAAKVSTPSPLVVRVVSVWFLSWRCEKMRRL